MTIIKTNSEKSTEQTNRKNRNTLRNKNQNEIEKHEENHIENKKQRVFYYLLKQIICRISEEKINKLLKRMNENCIMLNSIRRQEEIFF